MIGDCSKRLAVALLAWSLLGPCRAVAADAPLRITNGIISIDYNPADGTFSASRGATPFLVRATVGELQARKAKVDVATVGDSKQITIEDASGRTAMLMLREQLPFVLVKTTIKNAKAEPLSLNEATSIVLPLALAPPARDLRVLGYDGLAAADQAKTGPLYLAVANPATRAGVVCAWLTHERASGLVRSTVKGDQVRLEALSQYGRLQIPAASTAVGETLAIGYFDDTRQGLELYAEELALLHEIQLKPVPVGYMTWYHAGPSSETQLQQLAQWSAANLRKFGFDVLQIDDGWQPGRDAAQPGGPYPSGMKAAATMITEHGFQPGLWFMPFVWDHKRPMFAEHQDWFVRHADGSIYEVSPGGDALDMSHADASESLRGTIHRMANDWGYQFLKLDALWAGLAAKLLYPNPRFRPDDFGEAVFHDPYMTNVEAYRTGLKAVREGAGPKAYLLGSTMAQNMRTLGASIGLVDGMRVGIDSQQKWGGILENAKAATATYFLHGRVWHNDPDVVYLDKNFTLDQVRAWASWVAVTGQIYMLSDWLPGVAAERMEVVRRTIPNHNRTARPLDLWKAFPAEVWYVGDPQSKRHVLGLFNWGTTEKTVEVDLAQLSSDGKAGERYVGYDFWEGEVIDSISGTLGAKLRPTSCHVIVLRPALDRPQVVSTSRHVTQGLLDLPAEAWDPTNDSLVGVSRVVAGDPYEMRIVVPDPALKADVIGISPTDQEAQVTATGKQDGRWIRVTLQASENRNVSWQITFKRQGEAPPSAPTLGFPAP